MRTENGKTAQNSQFLNTVNVIDIYINNTSKNSHPRVRLNKACGHGTGCLLHWVYWQVGYILKGGGWPVKSETFWPQRLTHWIHERVTKQMWKVPRRRKLPRRPTSLTVPSVPRLLPTCVSTGRFKNTYELLNLKALKISMLYKIHIFQCMGKIFCGKFQRVPLKFHAKYLTHTLKDVDFISNWKFKSC